MSAFDGPSSDIDHTLPGQPYVVDSDGWGWFMLCYLAILPLVCLGILLSNAAVFLAEHILPALAIYGLLTLCYAFRLYRRRTAHRLLGIIATCVTALPVLLSLVCYAIPFVVLCPSVDSIFDFLLIFGLSVGGEILVCSLSRLFKNGLIHFLMASVFFLAALVLLMAGMATERELLTLANILAVYGIPPV